MSELVINRVRDGEPHGGEIISRRTVLTAVLVALGYYFSGRLGFAFAFQPGSVSTLWIPNSILLAALLLTPTRSWWITLLTALPAHVAAELQSGVPTPMVLCWFVSNCSQALIGAALIRGLSKEPVRFESLVQVSLFILFGAFLAPFLSSFLDIAFVKLNGWGNISYWELWRVRFFANVVASLTLVPLIVSWASPNLRSQLHTTRGRYLEAVLLGIGIIAVSLLVFSTSEPLAGVTPTLVYWPLPFLLWATVRFGVRGVSTCLAVVMFLAIWAAVHGRGPFVMQSAVDNALSIQLFLIVISLPLLALAAVIKERARAEEAVRQNEEQLAMALSAAQMGTWDWNIAGNTVHWSDETKRIFCVPGADSEITSETFLGMLHPKDRGLVEQAVDRAISEGSPYEAEYRIVQPDGTIRWVRGKGKVLCDESGKPVRMIGLKADISDQKLAEEALRESQEKLHRTNRQIRALAGQLITAQEAERRRISRELHDDLNQNMAALAVGISTLKRKLPADAQHLSGEVDFLREQANNLANEIRRLSHQLHPAVLEHLGLAAALESYVGEFKSEENIDVDLSIHIDDLKVPADMAVCLYRVTVEGLRNIARHSGARSASVLLACADGNVQLQVSDSGHGFDVQKAARGSGLGLVSAEERVRLLQGNFEIKSAPGRGTTLVAQVPLTR